MRSNQFSRKESKAGRQTWLLIEASLWAVLRDAAVLPRPSSVPGPLSVSSLNNRAFLPHTETLVTRVIRTFLFFPRDSGTVES